ncbi:MAG TPA: photosystem I reaction center subunit IX [Cyanobacteria bacterium UBA11372]|nr:photosystem I reaction center subunit IX [Cyanobacteria bacterium UBA11372]HBE36295.1 photosystem I reaction center subunit IX [Cyanobacteria bacterium UBA11368]HBE47414.1 photosystem I reaction center subunit IX [Cyanobacteria bacterium UBA11369]
MQPKYLSRYLSTAPVLATVWLSLQAALLIVFNYYFPDLLFHPMP